ncbi:S41 family peptidase [bacterium]|nr:MAG: S41 family peptidase [bacterium]
MKNPWLHKRTIGVLMVLLLSFSFFGGWFAESLVGDDYYYEVKRGIRLFGDVYKTITEKYVDEIPPKDFMRTGIDGLLATLDPYTVYYEGDESGDLDALMMGKYGGVGISVGIKDGFITVITTMDGSPAQRVGILPGDRIVGVNGLTAHDISLQEMSNFVKGEPGTKVRLTVLREGQDHRMDFELVREMIAVENISYTGMMNGSIGYIKITKFSKTANFDFVRALKDLKNSGMQSLILDLRGNPGGLLDAAIDVTNQFVKKGETITYTKGRIADASRNYNAINDPMFPDMPLVVLVDGGSASASEIVGGALQDLDRGVVIGSTTFGKGLVQTVYPLQERDAVIKITTAKYYTPSGRSIQKEDYSSRRTRKMERGDDGERDIFDTFGSGDTGSDSSKTQADRSNEKQVFKTAKGRSVYANGGITPDIEIASHEYTVYFREVLKRGLIFDYATNFVAHHARIDSDFAVDENLIIDFEKYLQTRNFNYISAAEKQMEEIERLAKKNNYGATAMDKIDVLRGELTAEKQKDFQNSKTFIAMTLEQEIVSRYFGNRARILTSFKYDKPYLAAVALLKNQDKYRQVLAGK